MTQLDLDIANTIRTQIGAPSFFMIGAKDYVAITHGLRFKIMRNPGKVTHVQIELNADDTYSVTFLAYRSLTMKTISTTNGVYANQLHAVIKEATKLELVMPRIFNGLNGKRLV